KKRAIPSWRIALFGEERFTQKGLGLRDQQVRESNLSAFEAIVYVLRTGIQWNALPRELGASSTVHDRFQQWEQAGFFKILWLAELLAYDELAGRKLGLASSGWSHE